MIAFDRLEGRRAEVAAAVAVALCAAIFWPGIVDQLDLDARPVNAVAALGVALAFALSIAAALAAPPSVGGRARWDLPRLVLALAVVFFALPYVFGEFGVFIERIPALGTLFQAEEPYAPFGQANLRPAVHLGHHHGFDGALLALAALTLSRVLGRMRRRRVQAFLALYLSVMLAYGIANEFQDAWNEQLVKRGLASWSVPSVLVPTLDRPFLVVLGAGAAIYLLLFGPLTRSWPRMQVQRATSFALAAAGAVVGAGVVALLCLGLTADGQTSPTPVPTQAERAQLRQEGFIAFAMVEPGTGYDLMVMRGDGSGRRDLTPDDHTRDLRPSWSPSGEIAFQSGRGGSANVYLLARDLRRRRRLTKNRASDGEAASSPRDASIAFVSDRDGNRETYVIRADGGERRLTRNRADDEWPAWAPGQSALVIQSDRDGDFDLYTIGQSGRLRRLTNLEGDERTPAWSPDGSRLAFAHDGDLYLIRADGRRLRRLTRGPAEDFAPAWSSDSRWIVFGSDRDGRDQLFVIRSRGGEARRLTSGEADKDAPDWSG